MGSSCLTIRQLFVLRAHSWELCKSRPHGCAVAKGVPPVDFTVELVAAEAAARRERTIARRIKHAYFPVVKTIDYFDRSETSKAWRWC